MHKKSLKIYANYFVVLSVLVFVSALSATYTQIVDTYTAPVAQRIVGYVMQQNGHSK